MSPSRPASSQLFPDASTYTNNTNVALNAIQKRDFMSAGEPWSRPALRHDLWTSPEERAVQRKRATSGRRRVRLVSPHGPPDRPPDAPDPSARPPDPATRPPGRPPDCPIVRPPDPECLAVARHPGCPESSEDRAESDAGASAGLSFATDLGFASDAESEGDLAGEPAFPSLIPGGARAACS